MALDPAANFIRGSIDTPIDATQTSVSVVDASIFPDPATDGEFNVVVWDAENHPRPDQDPNVEILRVTAIDTGTNTLTVVRAQEGTTGASHPSGSAVHLSPTAKMFSDIQTKTQGLSDDGTSLNIDFLDFGATTIEEISFSLDDDSVEIMASLGLAEEITGVLLIREVGSTRGAVIGNSRGGCVGLSSDRVTVFTGNNELTGTAGTDGELTVSRYFKQTRIENRTGSEIDLRASLINIDETQ